MNMTKNIKYLASAIVIAALLVPATSFALSPQKKNMLSVKKAKEETQRVISPARVKRPSLLRELTANKPVVVANMTATTSATTTDADLNDDGKVDGYDLGTVLGQWGHCPTVASSCLGDLNFDGVVNELDVDIVLQNWGPVVPSSPVVFTAQMANFNGDDKVDGYDLGTLLGNWGACAADPCIGDINGDGFVNETDTSILLKFWGPINS